MIPHLTARLRAAGCVFAEDEARLLVEAATGPAELEVLARRRIGGVPLEHVLGWADFCGLRIAVAPGVFVPRRRTEFLVRCAHAVLLRRAERLPADGPAVPVVLDLCCGCGAVGAALAARMAADARRVELHASDVDPAAVRCARRNLAAVAVQVYEGDLYQPLPVQLAGRVDVLVANVPYVPTGEIATMPAEARLHEPRPALDGGPDGLEVFRRVVAEARSWLAPGGHLLIETSRRQAPRALRALVGCGFVARVERCEELDATVLIASRA